MGVLELLTFPQKHACTLTPLLLALTLPVFVNAGHGMLKVGSSTICMLAAVFESFAHVLPQRKVQKEFKNLEDIRQAPYVSIGAPMAVVRRPKLRQMGLKYGGSSVVFCEGHSPMRRVSAIAGLERHAFGPEIQRSPMASSK